MYRQDGVYTVPLPIELKQLYERFPQKPMIELADALKREYETAKKCHICLKEFNYPQNKKVKDNCHFTSFYREAAHNNGNMKYWIAGYILNLLHNLTGYDAHLFIKELERRFKRKNIGIIAENKEKYISFNVKVKIKLAGVRNEDGT